MSKIPPVNNPKRRFDDDSTSDEEMIQQPPRKVGNNQYFRQVEDQYGPRITNRISTHISRNTPQQGGSFLPPVVWSTEELRDTQLYRALVSWDLDFERPLPPIKPPSFNPLPLKTMGELDDMQLGQAQIMSEGEVGEIEILSWGRKYLTDIFGRELSDDQIRGLAGGRRAGKVKVTFELVGDNRVIRAKISLQPDKTIQENTLYAWRETNGQVSLEQSHCQLDRKAPRYLGGCLLIVQIHTARSLGVTAIQNLASRDEESGFNGYYTWACYGGDAPLDSNRIVVPDHDDIRKDYLRFLGAFDNPGAVFDKVCENEKKFSNLVLDREKFIALISGLKDQRFTVQDLMATPEGRAFWRCFGFSVFMTYDLGQNSRTMEVLRQYGGKHCCFDLSGGF